MLYILAGAQIGQSPKKNWKACRHHMHSKFLAYFYKLTAASDVWCDIIWHVWSRPDPRCVWFTQYISYYQYIYMFTCFQLWPMYGEPPVLLPGPVWGMLLPDIHLLGTKWWQHSQQRQSRGLSYWHGTDRISPSNKTWTSKRSTKCV